MSRFCPKCGWEFPSCFTNSKCKFCNTEFNTQYCSRCGKEVPTSEMRRHSTGKLIKNCKPCVRELRNAYNKANPDKVKEQFKNINDGHRNLAAQRLAEWQELTNVPMRLLNEDDWLRACSHFNGCAMCGSDDIGVRELFIPFGLGGKYTPWNVIPVCEQCASKGTRNRINPFMWFDNRLGGVKYSDIDINRLEIVLDYLKKQIERND